MAKSLLLELGCEELPARFIAPALAQLVEAVTKGLEQERIEFGTLREFATPRRLAVLIDDVSVNQRDLIQERRGPSKEIAFDAEGNPTKAAMGFARGAGVSPQDLIVKQTEQGEYVYAVIQEPGGSSLDVLPQVLAEALSQLSFPKSMRWGSGDTRFARPVRWIAALFGETVVDFTFAGVKSGRTTRGHRVLSEWELTIATAQEYPAVMERGFVVADLATRKEMIRSQVEEVAAKAGGVAVIDPDLLHEVTCLVEYPTALVGQFDPSFLEIPPEVLITSMQAHQRYFPVIDGDHQLLPLFIAIRNGGSEYLETVKQGNEKVLSARLSDARFFYHEDQAQALADKIEALKAVVFQERLGTIYDKTQRIRQLSQRLASHLGWDQDQSTIDRTALLCKADLVTNMVNEFPELQGVMGREYAKLSGEGEDVATGIFEHYLPRFAGDDLPGSKTGTVVGLADRMDTIVGSFAVGMIPTGSQDPYGLRRRTLAVLQIVLDQKLEISINQLIDWSMAAYGELVTNPEEVRQEVHDFFDQRFRGVLLEMGFRYDLVDAVMAVASDDPCDCLQRLEVLRSTADSESFTRLLTGFHRAANLVDKQGVPSISLTDSVLTEAAEKQLFAALEAREEPLQNLLQARDYRGVEEMLAELQEPIDRFFDEVMVMVEDETQRNIRLALLGKVVAMMTQMADLRKVVQ